MQTGGLASDVEQVYHKMLDRSDGTVGRLAEELGWSEARVRRVLDVLSHMGPVLSDDDAGRPPATDARAELATLLVHSETMLNWRRQQIEASLAAASALAAEYGRAREAPEVVDRLDGLAAVQARLMELAESAELERQAVSSGGGTPDPGDGGGPGDGQTPGHGSRMRSIYQDTVRTDPSTLECVRWLTELGGENRTVPTLPVMMIIVGRRTALIPLDPADVQRGALELRSPEAVKAMHALFDKLWAIATPWHESTMSDDRRLTPVQREVIELLGAGHTDEVISRRIGVSLRTVRRITADLMTRLMARSRFEAGVRAAKLGWL